MARTSAVVRGTRALALIAVALSCAALASAAPKSKTSDLTWTRPDVAALGVSSIAMLPVTSYDQNLEAEKMVAQLLGAALRPSGYRWISAPSVIERVRGDADATALLKAARESMVAKERVDSLVAPLLCARLRVDAVLAVRIDQWEQRKIEWNEAGKPSTTARVRAALVDSTGRLLWTISGSELGEGPFHDPNVSPVGVTSTGLGMQPLTNQGGPPSFQEVVSRLCARWAPLFPAMPAPPAPAPASTPGQ